MVDFKKWGDLSLVMGGMNLKWGGGIDISLQTTKYLKLFSKLIFKIFE